MASYFLEEFKSYNYDKEFHIPNLIFLIHGFYYLITLIGQIFFLPKSFCKIKDTSTKNFSDLKSNLKLTT